MFCSKCGKELVNGVCTNRECDNQAYSTATVTPPTMAPVQSPSTPEKPDKSNVGLNILSFFVPIFGIIWYFVKKSERPKEAKGTLKTAIVSIVINLVIAMVLTVLMFIGLFAGFGVIAAADIPRPYEQETEITTQEPSDTVTQSQQSEEYLPELPHSIAYQDYQIEVGSSKIKLPVSYGDFCEQTGGFWRGYGFDNQIKLDKNQLETVSVVYADYDEPLLLTVTNTSNDGPKKIEDCTIVGITQLDDCGTPIIFANGMYVGMETTKENIKSAFGEPYEVDENNLYCRMTYYEDYEEYGSGRNFTIRLVNGVITEISTTKLR